jgi:hypothetical protein
MARKVLIGCILVVLMGVQTAFAIAGFGVHWGLDLSLSMEDMEREQTSFEDLKIPLTEVGTVNLPPSSWTDPEIGGDMLPIFISRTGWERTWLNLGAKFYIDIIPVINAVELSFNLGAWQYLGKIIYPTGLEYKATVPTTITSPDELFQATYDTTFLTIDSLGGKGLLGLHLTPYAKMQFDATVRKNIFAFPPVVNIIKFYAGGGPSLHFATPVLSTGLIEDALGTQLSGSKGLTELGNPLFGSNEVMKAVTEEIIKNMFTPHFGMHLVAGVSVKPPIFPIGLYADGKLMIPFGKMDKHVDIGGLGLLLNVGLTMGL